MNSSLKSGLVLLILGVICGTLLAVVNSITAPYIEQAEILARNEALADFYDLDGLTLDYEEFEDDSISTKFTLSEDDQIVAIVYQVSANGQNGPITMMIAVNSDYTIEGYIVVSHSEDAGYGLDIVDNDFGVYDLSTVSEDFDTVAGVTHTSDGILECFTIVAENAVADFGGDLDD